MPEPTERNDLVEPEGVNAGSTPAERDRRPSGEIDVEPRRGDPEGDAEPEEELVGLPDQPFGVPGQQLEAGEG